MAKAPKKPAGGGKKPPAGKIISAAADKMLRPKPGASFGGCFRVK